MHKAEEAKKRNIINRAGVIAVSAAIALTVAACGGGSSSGSGTANGGSAQDDGANGSASAPSGASTPSTNASFFDGIFLKGTGTGYYQFNISRVGQGIAASGITQYYVNSDTDSNFSLAPGTVAGSVPQQTTAQVYITAEGAFSSQSTADTDIGTNSKIFSVLPQGYEFGMQGMSTPLYSVTVNATDVSGQSVGSVIQQDENAYPTGLYVLRADTTPMPQGAQIYQVPHNVITTYLWLDQNNAYLGTTLEAQQALSGGQIQSLGGYRYLMNSSSESTGFIEYNGTVYNGTIARAGDEYSAVGAGYNTIAANFIAQRMAAAQAK